MKETGLTYRQVKIWMTNNRARILRPHVKEGFNLVKIQPKKKDSDGPVKEQAVEKKIQPKREALFLLE